MIALLLACAGAPQDALTWRESIELLGILDGQGVLDARITIGNTGTMRGQGRLRLERWNPSNNPIRFSQHGAPQQMRRSAEGITMVDNGLLRSSSGWILRVVDENLSGLVELSSDAALRPEAAWLEGSRQWTVAAEAPMGSLSGWLSAGERGGAVSGVGVILHRGGDGIPALPRRAAFVLHERVNLGFDAHGSGVLQWAIIDGVEVPVDDLRVDLSAASPTLELPAAELRVVLHPWAWDGWSNPMDHLTGIEALLGGAIIGRPTRRIRAARADIQLEGAALSGPALLLDVLPEPQAP